ncbi:HAMP domain-containing sensor histidine kinase [Anaeromyxobacter sp. PSR-1]|uniref:sensor histidine kinase n=1 Tax=unclassified Anaeromyxobacter TaxID=2620896 RepID=UPI0005DD69E1|nr:HAMP domain-containing sensor histidine kinase [Anaeromyxobacter sp. PSR-1]GAO03734.1 sensor protein ZraS [Anaeromyxobacter sp. PSR-1]
MNLLERSYRSLDSSMRARVLVPTALLFAVTLSAMVAAAVHFYGADMESGRQDRAELFATMVSSGVSNVMLSGKPREVTTLLEALVAHRSDLLSASLIAPNGYISISTSPALLGRVPWSEVNRVEGTTVVVGPGGNDAEYAVLQPIVNAESCARCHGTQSHVNGWLDLRFTREPVLEAQAQLAKTLSLSAAAAFVCLLAILLWLLGREAVSPLQRLVAVMRRAESGELTVRADEGRPDELGVAARGFDATLAALRRSQAELEAFYRERMVRADRFAAVGEIATGLAHEIKNPLAGLSGALELLAEDFSADARHSEIVGEMQHQVRRLTHTMESLLSFARPAKAKLRSTDVNATLEKVLFLIRQQSRDGTLELVPELAPGLPAVLADPSQLEQVFLNICLNACQAMIATRRGGVLTVRSRVGDGTVSVEVEDTGPGIPADLRAQIFKPFFTTKREGNGLGLAISARIVAEHGGHIGYRCPPEGGTTFTVTLQQARPQRAPEHAA